MPRVSNAAIERTGESMANEKLLLRCVDPEPNGEKCQVEGAKTFIRFKVGVWTWNVSSRE